MQEYFLPGSLGQWGKVCYRLRLACNLAPDSTIGFLNIIRNGSPQQGVEMKLDKFEKIVLARWMAKTGLGKMYKLNCGQ